VKLILRIPVGVKLLISEDMDRFTYNYDYWSCEGVAGRRQSVMTEDGLKCAMP
jgi:hypothetical protein